MFLPSAHRTELEVQRDTIDNIPSIDQESMRASGSSFVSSVG